VYPLTLGLVIGTKHVWDEVQSCIRELPVRVLMEQTSIGSWTDFREKLEHTKPDLLVLDLAQISEPLESVIARIKTLSAPPLVAVVHDDPSPAIIMDAVRAGAGEFLYPPVQTSLLKALTRLSDEREHKKGSARRGGQILSFLSAKGGCGATTLACHVAVELARQTQQQSLVADLDVDAGMVGFLMKSKSEYSLLDAIRNIHKLDLSYWKKLVSNGVPNLEIITAPPVLNASEAMTRENLKAITAFTRSHYEWTVMDLGRGLSQSTLTALEAVDQAFLVTTMEVPALHQTRQMVQRLLDSGFPREKLRLVINKMAKRSDLTVPELEKALGQDVYATVPDDYESLHESYSEGRLLQENTIVRRSVAQLARRIAGIQEQQTKKRFPFLG
jgi:pilus assembly protein CpaE